MNRALNFLFTALLVSVFSCAPGWAQTSTAQINGTVRDQSGAVLPGADVTATQVATGAKRSAVTNETGSYTLTNLPIGPYTLEVALPGFRTYVQSGIVLQVSDNRDSSGGTGQRNGRSPGKCRAGGNAKHRYRPGD